MSPREIAHALDGATTRTGGSLPPDQALRYLERIAVALETLAANGSPVIQPIAPKAPQKPSSRGAKRKDAEGDRKIYEAWESDHYRTFADCGRELGISEKRDVELAVGRYRKYLTRHPGKD
jgi:hypothetical protein